MKDRYWTELVFSLRQGQCALVLGRELAATHDLAARERETDVSRIGNPLARHLARQLAEEGKTVAGEDLAAIAQQYEEASEFGGLALRTQAVNFYSAPTLTIPDAYDKLAALPFKLVVTTGYDNRFELALEGTKPAKRPQHARYNFRGDKIDNPEPPVGSVDNPLVYHLFGDIETPNSLVLSENDLLDFLIAAVSKAPQLPNNLTHALKRQSQSFLFVGFGLRQWYLRLLLKVLLRHLELDKRSFALEARTDFPEGDLEQTVLLYRRGMRVEIIDIDIDAFLDELTQRVSREGGYARQAPLLGPRLRIFICHASEDKATAQRLYDRLAASNCDPWLDADALQGGDDWNIKIETALQDTHYVVILHSASLVSKTDSYVNKEIGLAFERGQRVRGNFIFPLLLEALPEDRQIDRFKTLQQLPLREPTFAEDVDRLLKDISRDFQLRNR